MADQGNEKRMEGNCVKRSAKDIIELLKQSTSISTMEIEIVGMRTVAIVEQERDSDGSMIVSPLVLIITDEMFAALHPVLRSGEHVTVEGYEKN